MSGGARRCSVQSPPTVCVCAVNICRLSLSISVGCHCQNLTLSPLSIFATTIIMPLTSSSHGSHGSHGSQAITVVAVAVAVVLCRYRCLVSLPLSLNVNIQKLKLFHMEQLPHTKNKIKNVPYGTITARS